MDTRRALPCVVHDLSCGRGQITHGGARMDGRMSARRSPVCSLFYTNRTRVSVGAGGAVTATWNLAENATHYRLSRGSRRHVLLASPITEWVTGSQLTVNLSGTSGTYGCVPAIIVAKVASVRGCRFQHPPQRRPPGVSGMVSGGNGTAGFSGKLARTAAVLLAFWVAARPRTSVLVRS